MRGGGRDVLHLSQNPFLSPFSTVNVTQRQLLYFLYSLLLGFKTSACVGFISTGAPTLRNNAGRSRLNAIHQTWRKRALICEFAERHKTSNPSVNRPNRERRRNSRTV